MLPVPPSELFSILTDAKQSYEWWMSLSASEMLRFVNLQANATPRTRTPNSNPHPQPQP